MFLRVVLEDVLYVLGEVFFTRKASGFTVLKKYLTTRNQKDVFSSLFLLVEKEFSKLPSLAYFSYLNGTKHVV